MRLSRIFGNSASVAKSLRIRVFRDIRSSLIGIYVNWSIEGRFFLAGVSQSPACGRIGEGSGCANHRS